MIDWKYVITPRNDEAKKVIQEHLLPDFQGMLEQAIRISKEHRELGNQPLYRLQFTFINGPDLNWLA